MNKYLPLILGLLVVFSQCQTQNIQKRLPSNIDSCKWSRSQKRCVGTSNRCSGNSCCRSTGTILPNGLPQCVCKTIAEAGPCETCVWTSKTRDCVDPTGTCSGSKCCMTIIYERSTEFECKCIDNSLDDPIITIDQCKWNNDFKKCEDFSGLCPIKGKCCKPTGALDSQGFPQCRCTGRPADGDCDTCKWSNLLTSCQSAVVASGSPETTCNSGSCCGLVPVSGTSFSQCKCQGKCLPDPPITIDSCRWNNWIKKCEDLTGNCAGDKCCLPTGKIFSNGPECACRGSIAEGECDNCMQRFLDQQVKIVGRCQRASQRCMKIYFSQSRNPNTPDEWSSLYTYGCKVFQESSIFCLALASNQSECRYFYNRSRRVTGMSCPTPCDYRYQCTPIPQSSYQPSCTFYNFQI